jgi:hypothetical protein
MRQVSVMRQVRARILGGYRRALQRGRELELRTIWWCRRGLSQHTWPADAPAVSAPQSAPGWSSPWVDQRVAELDRGEDLRADGSRSRVASSQSARALARRQARRAPGAGAAATQFCAISGAHATDDTLAAIGSLPSFAAWVTRLHVSGRSASARGQPDHVWLWRRRADRGQRCQWPALGRFNREPRLPGVAASSASPVDGAC